MGSWWDLGSLDKLYSEFLEENLGRLESWRELVATQEDAELDARAFADYLLLITQWRRLPYSDPGLPQEFLPEGWNAAPLWPGTHSRIVRALVLGDPGQAPDADPQRHPAHSPIPAEPVRKRCPRLTRSRFGRHCQAERVFENFC